jgi:mannose-6-phosphate isomerase-like protein (cupin superfamily)
MGGHFHGRFDDWLRRLPEPPAESYAVAFESGTMTVGLYSPRGVDPQSPHDRDEVYVVVRGRGSFVAGETRRPFGPGDLLFVAAGVEHCFEDFTDDLAVWVVFAGPKRDGPGGRET